MVLTYFKDLENNVNLKNVKTECIINCNETNLWWPRRQADGVSWRRSTCKTCDELFKNLHLSHVCLCSQRSPISTIRCVQSWTFNEHLDTWRAKGWTEQNHFGLILYVLKTGSANLLFLKTAKSQKRLLKVVLGDTLPYHLSAGVLKPCEQHNIYSSFST